jgi:hypothetical protein
VSRVELKFVASRFQFSRLAAVLRAALNKPTTLELAGPTGSASAASDGNPAAPPKGRADGGGQAKWGQMTGPARTGRSAARRGV